MLKKLGTSAVGIAAAVTVLASGPALAQKSKDTLRAVSEQPISLLDRIYNPQPATTLMTSVVFDGLLQYDPIARKIVPNLAKSWTRIDEYTVELDLRDDVTFHNGDKFTADDVVATIGHMIDPTTQFRFKANRYGWIKAVEKVSDYKVRVIAKKPFSPALIKLGNDTLMHPKGPFLANPKEFGKNPIGTGPYRVEQVDSTDGVIMKKFDDFKLQASYRPEAKIGTVEIKPVTDRQTQFARLMVGEQDLMSSVPADEADALAQNPNLKVTVMDTVSFSYMQFDSADRGKIGYLKDPKVRLALSMAVNREAIKKALTPAAAHNIPLPGGMCHKWINACDYSTKLPAYNPEKAKQLLAEAGYPDGFPLELTSWGAVGKIAEAVVGDLRKVGVKASLDHVTYGVYSKKRSAGKLQTLISYWDNAGGQPDIDNTMGFFYLPGVRDYMQDKRLHEMTGLTRAEFDPEKRQALVREAMDRVTENNYLMPLISVPAVVVHSKDVVLHNNHKSPEGYLYNYMEWAK